MINLTPPHIVHNYQARSAPITELPPHYLTWLDWYWQEITNASSIIGNGNYEPTDEQIAAFLSERDALRQSIPLYERATLSAYIPADELTSYTAASLLTDN